MTLCFRIISMHAPPIKSKYFKTLIWLGLLVILNIARKICLIFSIEHALKWINLKRYFIEPTGTVWRLTAESSSEIPQPSVWSSEGCLKGTIRSSILFTPYLCHIFFPSVPLVKFKRIYVAECSAC